MIMFWYNRPARSSHNEAWLAGRTGLNRQARLYLLTNTEYQVGLVLVAGKDYEHEPKLYCTLHRISHKEASHKKIPNS